MINNSRAKLEALISKIGISPKSSSLLQAYATFKSMKDCTPDSLSQCYAEVCSQSPADSIISGRAISDANNAFQAYTEFRKFSFEEFLRFIVPDLITDISSFMRIFQEYFDSDICQITHFIIRIRVLMYTQTGENKLHDNDNSTASEVADRIYSRYSSDAKNVEYPIEKSIFLKLYLSINLFTVYADEHLKIKTIGYKAEDLDTVIDIFYNQLELSREQQFDVCKAFYILKRPVNFFVGNEKLQPFTRIKDTSERIKLYKKALTILAKIPPADAVSAISVRRKQQLQKTVKFTNQVYSPNDVPIENSLVYSLFTSTVGPVSDENEAVTILLPSVFFARKWLSDRLLTKQKVCFVFENSAVCDLIDYHYHNKNYMRNAGSNVAFLSLDDWKNKISSGEQTIRNEKVLAFFCGKALSVQNDIYNLLYKQNCRIELFLVLGSSEFDSAKSPFSTAFSDGRFVFHSIELIPQGINNSAYPHRKMIVQAEIASTLFEEKKSFYITADTLNHDMKIQTIARSTLKPVEVGQDDLNLLNISIRKLFEKEMLTRKSVDKHKLPAISFPFTPDINIWYSKTYPKGNLKRPRLEAYFCEFASEGKAERGFADRGNVLKETRKHITKLTESEITYWLNNIYPFENVRQRRSKNKEEISDTDVFLSVREAAIEYYSSKLQGENIALKTFWYLYPNLEDYFYSDGKKYLGQMMLFTELGVLRIQDITPAEVEEILENSFPADSDTALLQKFKIISKVIDIAKEFGYCFDNPLEQELRDIKKADKLFAQVRKALTKKHFTKAEFQRLFSSVTEGLYNGKTEYLGVLLRLLTGMSSNIICALKWKNIVSLPEYGIKKIVTEKQLVNDGSGAKGFESLEDYLCFPCSDVLAYYLETVYKLTREKHPAFSDIGDWPGIRDLEDDKQRGANRYYPPRELDKLCKELIKCLQLPDNIIAIPDNADGTKETNLNKYGGDFLRENFRFWTLSFAGMTNDETAYLIGNTPETTFGRYYCDYLNDASQYLMYVKLRRIDALLLSAEKFSTVKESTSHGEFGKTIVTDACPTEMQLRLSLPNNSTRVDVKLESKFAMSVFAAKVGKERAE